MGDAIKMGKRVGKKWIAKKLKKFMYAFITFFFIVPNSTDDSDLK